jgi:hypothetical protein
MKVQLTKYASKILLSLKEHLDSEDSDVVELAIISLYEKYVDEGKLKDIHDEQPKSLMESLENAGLLDRTFRCVINSNLEEYYINAKTEEEAWQKMASKFSDEVVQGFTIEEYDDFNINLLD